ncbi:Adaptive-response sensory-kinase SasA [Capillimicrobium parvum]|uniref:Sensor-like histidine kinase SenX3 n=1 Tax=Capillimicrobium parvum TaxID=2884022 RepID=A0A9E6XYG6_9ACTN|nr:Adaptive-response sensory-kinase SasA [Capillimicrobium parvum]
MPTTDAARTAQLALLVDSVVDYAIFLLDPAGHVATWNAGAERIKRYRADEIIGRHFSVFYTEDDRARRYPQYELEVATREGRFEDEGWRVRADGTRFWANVIITALRGPDGSLEGFGKVTRDLSARREAEETLRRAQEQLARSNEELDRFAVVAAHDLTEPIATVAGFARLLSERHGASLPPEGREFLGHMLASADRMQRLVGTLLMYARSGRSPHEATAVDVSQAARHVIADLATQIRDRGAQVIVNLDPGVCVCANRSEVELVLQNLISNAVKFADDETPVVAVSAERDPDADGGWIVSITDNGPGIDPADQRRIFEAFERAPVDAARRGTGLGLAICERVVTRRGGRIGVESAPGEGSRFWFALPEPDGSPSSVSEIAR